MLVDDNFVISMCASVALVASVGLGVWIFTPTKSSDQEPVGPKVVELHITETDTPENTEIDTTKRIQPVPGHGICTGFFVDAAGDIMTAKHCVEGVESIDVETSDGRIYSARFVAKSDLHDLALIRISKSNTPFFRLAKSVVVGETVNTQGNPMGLKQSFSRGLVAKLLGDTDVIDCTIVPGNSGGPAFDYEGNLIGVTTAVFVSQYGMTRLGVIQSLDSVREFLNQILGKKNHEAY